MINTSLAKIRDHSPCIDSWAKLLRALGKKTSDTEDLPMEDIYDILGFSDTVWCARTVPEHYSVWTWFAMDCTDDVTPMFENAQCVEMFDAYCKHEMGAMTTQAFNKTIRLASKQRQIGLDWYAIQYLLDLQNGKYLHNVVWAVQEIHAQTRSSVYKLDPHKREQELLECLRLNG